MSIKTAIITPISHIEKYSIYGDIEMCLTHIVVDYENKIDKNLQNRYIKYFQDMQKQRKFIILDNSAYELGKLQSSSASGMGLGPDLVFQAAEIIKPTIIICQDVLCNKDDTISATKDFIKYAKQKNPDVLLMGVAQGKTEDEWLECYQELYNLREIDMIGFSKISVPICFAGTQQQSGAIADGRLKCTEKINKLFLNPKPAHLLGGDNLLPYELSIQKNFNWIFSNDSSAMVWYGYNYQRYDNNGKASSLIIEKPDLECYNHCTKCILDTEEVNDNITHNILTLQRMSK